jgi:hypothetical protein
MKPARVEERWKGGGGGGRRTIINQTKNRGKGRGKTNREV